MSDCHISFETCVGECFEIKSYLSGAMGAINAGNLTLHSARGFLWWVRQQFAAGAEVTRLSYLIRRFFAASRGREGIKRREGGFAAMVGAMRVSHSQALRWTRAALALTRL